jgi:hypothetical protein
LEGGLTPDLQAFPLLACATFANPETFGATTI